MDKNNGNGTKNTASTEELVAVHDSLTSALLAALDSRNRSEREQTINQQAAGGQ